jgi:hypothetical protein
LTHGPQNLGRQQHDRWQHAKRDLLKEIIKREEHLVKQLIVYVDQNSSKTLIVGVALRSGLLHRLYYRCNIC